MGHIFPFSPKRGTSAARMPQVPPAVVKERARRLRGACAKQRTDWLEGLVGSRQRVLVEKDGFGHAENFAPVRTGSDKIGEVAEVTITGIDGDILIGEAA
jgi:threonylcarbamoyladenosine tRNA methylthiotransferase MtaB